MSETTEGSGGAAAGREHRTVTRVTAILESVAARPDGVRLADLVTDLGAPKSSVHGFARGLVAVGYLVEESGVYRIGPAVAALLASSRPTAVEVARPVMEALRAEFDETVTLAELVGNSFVYLLSVDSTQLIRYSAPLHQRRPLMPPSAGKVFLAHLPARKRQAYLRSYVDASHASRPAADVEAELAEIRESGVAVNRGETLPDITGVASGIVVGDAVGLALSIAGPTTRMADKVDAATVALRAAAARVGGRLR